MISSNSIILVVGYGNAIEKNLWLTLMQREIILGRDKMRIYRNLLDRVYVTD